jgi:hypothetical protein
MKKLLIVAATAGLMTLAACQPTATNNTTTVDTNVTVVDEANAAAYNDTTTTAIDNAAPAVDANSTDMNMTGNTM